MELQLWQLAGFKLEVVNTTSAGHARKLASSVDISTCPDGTIPWLIISWHPFLFAFVLAFWLCSTSLWFNQFVQIVLFSGIICVGGDGIINEVSHLRWSFLFIFDKYSTNLQFFFCVYYYLYRCQRYGKVYWHQSQKNKRVWGLLYLNLHQMTRILFWSQWVHNKW